MLKEIIDEFYKKQEENRDREYFYVTDAGKCKRATFLTFKNAPAKDLEPRVLRIFEKGEYHHRNLISSLIRMGIVVAAEISTPPQAIISGRADAILSIDSQLYVLDIKSTNSNAFRYMKNPKEKHLYQIQLYLHFFNIQNGILLYVDKDQQKLKEFEIDYDPDLANNLMKQFSKLKDKIDNNVVPARNDSYPSKGECRYCKFKELCKKAEEGEMNWENLKEKFKDN